MKQRRSELPINEQGRFYHINCGPGDLAQYILTCGDPRRAERTAARFDQVDTERRHREFAVFTGTYHDIPLSVMATGIGPDNTAIAVIESAQCVDNPSYIRLGSSGAIQNDINLGDLVITRKALRYEDTSLNYAAPELEAVASPEILKALQKAARDLDYRHHLGTTCSTSDFYGGQGREVPGFPIRNSSLVENLRKKGVKNFEMEMAVYLTLARTSSYNLRAGGVCAVFSHRIKDKLVSGQELVKAERKCITTGLRAVEILHQ